MIFLIISQSLGDVVKSTRRLLGVFFLEDCAKGRSDLLVK